MFNISCQLSAGDDFIITKDGATHKLVISNCKEEHSGKYSFEADGRKTEATINVKGLKYNSVLQYITKCFLPEAMYAV